MQFSKQHICFGSDTSCLLSFFILFLPFDAEMETPCRTETEIHCISTVLEVHRCFVLLYPYIVPYVHIVNHYIGETWYADILMS